MSRKTVVLAVVTVAATTAVAAEALRELAAAGRQLRLQEDTLRQQDTALGDLLEVVEHWETRCQAQADIIVELEEELADAAEESFSRSDGWIEHTALLNDYLNGADKSLERIFEANRDGRPAKELRQQIREEAARALSRHQDRWGTVDESEVQA